MSDGSSTDTYRHARARHFDVEFVDEARRGHLMPGSEMINASVVQALALATMRIGRSCPTC